MFQIELLRKLKAELPKETSLNEAVTIALDISYDAAHRRTSLKSKLSIDESVTLAKYYNLSLDQLFETTDANIITVKKTKPIHNENELKIYFDNSFTSLHPLLNQKDCNILYSAKDIPLFYTLDNNLLSRFKIYVWLKLLDASMAQKSFESFSLKITTINSAKKLGALYENLNTTEIWDITTVNSTLKQIYFYYQAGHITRDTTLNLCSELKKLIIKISTQVNSENTNFNLYYNELLLMNNNVLVSTPQQQSLFVPFTILSYYQTSDKITCRQAQEFLNKQLQSSKLLNTSGEREKQVFFNKLFSKISALKNLIEASTILDFE